MSKVCLVTGASSGIGLATALELRRAGHTVYGAARRVERMAPLEAAGGHALRMDVTDEAEVRRAVDTVSAAHGGVDVLVNNAGIGLYGSAEEVPLERARACFEVDVYAPARLVQLVLPYMRERRFGRIVNVSSIGGVITLPMGAWYHAAKHALEAYSDCLRQEVGGFGIDVVLIEPGLIRTEFGHGTMDDLREVSGRGPYRAMAERMAAGGEAAFDENSRASGPDVVAAAIRRAAEVARPKPRYVVGSRAKPVVGLYRLLPTRMWDRLATKT
ncbi:oxidoreductase [Nonomuraea longicatena]|uniref:Oxidoreductase n=1 Tax=Nonomuraea longicatena TaxID=83682 RepID=A0ABN1QKK0_9ACTN